MQAVDTDASASDPEARLRALELENAALYEGAAVGYITIDGDGRICHCNRAAAALFGRDAEALGGHLLSAFVERLDVPALASFCARARSGVDAGAATSRLAARHRRCASSASPRRWSRGRPAAALH
jgi:PAS domain S-box-containing protein